MNHYIIDYETLVNCTVFCAQHYKNSDDLKVFVIHPLKNDTHELVNFLQKNAILNEFHISFNGIDFDSQISQFILDKANYFIANKDNPTKLANDIYQKAQRLIEEEKDFKTLSKNLSIKQIDLFKLNHWDSPAKKSSLKWIQYSMDWYNVEDMPIHHSTNIETVDQLDTVIRYCINDVKSTAEIYFKCREQIALRQSLTKTFGIDLFSASEPRIAKTLFSLLLSKKIGIRSGELNKLRTHRDNICVKDIILPYVKFKTLLFKSILDKFNEQVINSNNTKGGFKYSIKHKGVKTDFGLGGVHGAAPSGIYEAKDGIIIMSSDVASFYPNLAIKNRWSPAHLPQEEFCDQYEWFFEERKKIPKKDPKNYVYKTMLNGTYGLSNDENSFLYDPLYTLQTTCNGQLLLMMLYEMLSEGIPGSVPIMQNTDGLEMMIPAHYKSKYLEICKEWEDITSLSLEHEQYNKIILSDVNNYIAVLKTKECSKIEWDELKKTNPHYIFTVENDKYFYNATKCKGRFEFNDLALHKNKSFLIIPKAIYYYFVHDVQPEHYLRDNQNIFDYCAGVKAKGDWVFIETCYSKFEKIESQLQKIVRYYVSNKGCKLIKRNTVDGREIQLEAGKWLQTTFNTYVSKEWTQYDINMQYYIEEIYKEISGITRIQDKNQLTLF